MASIASLGEHMPSGFQYLLDERILRTGSGAPSYSWRTFKSRDPSNKYAEEELVTTGSCVIWSRGGTVKKIFRFDIEKEPVKAAVFARFSDPHAKSGSGRGRRGVGTHEAPPLIVPKKRTNPSSNDTKHSSATLAGTRMAANAGSMKPKQPHDAEDVAVVVFLKTQAHVYFLSGATYLVHLPFDIEAVFPLPSGLIVQRKTRGQDPRKQNSAVPPVPFNSFAISQNNTAEPNQLKIPEIKDGSIPADCPPAIEAMLRSVLGKSNKPKDADLAAHFFLHDPLSELRVLLQTSSSKSSNRRASSVRVKKLDQNEKLVYLSSESEIAHSLHGIEGRRLLLAVTVNRTADQCSIWKVSRYPSGHRLRNDRRFSSRSGSFMRRRSSFGPGTGATTPAARTSMGPRESFGHFQDLAREPNLVQNDVELASQLDPAFENPAAPAQATRRISSLLARSELTGGRDASSYADLTAGNQGLGTKRGQSFGTHGVRKSSGTSFGYQDRSRRTAGGSHIENGSIADAHPSMHDTTTEESDSDTEESDLVDLDGRMNALFDQEEMVFTRIYAFGWPNSAHQSHISASSQVSLSIEVFTLTPPVSSPSAYDAGQFVLCIMDKNARKLFVLQVSVTQPSSRRQDSRDVDEVEARINNLKIGENVIDACKISEGSCSRIVVLEEATKGVTNITLQSPWNTLFRVKLPSQLFTVNPYQADEAKAVAYQRDGGFRRVHVQRPIRFTALRRCFVPGLFDASDPSGVQHHLQVRLLPENELVARAIRVCEFVLPAQDVECEPLLRAWWEVMSSLLQQAEYSEDLEWKALIVVIFSMFVGFLTPSMVSKPTRTKRKGGLLRSSSGAFTDLESFDEMMKLECTSDGAFPSWLQDDCWSWMTEIKPPAAPSPTSKMKAKVGPSSSTLDDPYRHVVKKRTLLRDCAELAREFVNSESGIAALGETGYLPTASHVNAKLRLMVLPKTLLALHLLREELKLNVLLSDQLHALTPILAQLGGWMDWENWGYRSTSFYMLESTDMENWLFDESSLVLQSKMPLQEPEIPSILEHLEELSNGDFDRPFPNLNDICSNPRTAVVSSNAVKELTPRTALLVTLMRFQDSGPSSFVRVICEAGMDIAILDTLPEGVAAPIRSAIASCQADPGPSLSPAMLEMIDRIDIRLFEQQENIGRPQYSRPSIARLSRRVARNTNDGSSKIDHYERAAEMDRGAVTRMIFKDDQRFYEAARILHPLRPTEAKCLSEPDWSDTDLLEAQQELAKVVATRTLSVSPGRSMIYYCARSPLLTEKVPIHGFSLACVMRPGGNTVTADKSFYTEEKVSWAFFHAGVEAGLSISKDAKGIDTSWILYNKPQELNNRHAGFLLALGLNGHLKSIAKWVAFKYLTPKHTMTSIGLLLGLAASYLGTMDTLITRLLSVHVTRMLPPGAAELNLSPLTQTTGIMAIGLLYCNTQHRRMSEIMLSEIENIEQDETISPMENLRDEGYRLAAGFSLGYINLGQGRRLKGLRDMRIVERLLALAVATKRVDIVHILDKATAAATIALALIFMKTEDEALARKIDIPDTVHQFEYVRPDIFLLRTVARHIIMWKNILPTFAWIREQVPPSLKDQCKLNKYTYLHSEQLPLFNIVAGLCLSIGLRFAGTTRTDVRDLLCHYLDCFRKITSTPGTSYDEKLTRITARNCQDVVALAAAAVMAGTGDLPLLQRFRVLHGRSDPDTPYGSHLAIHQAIGVLFLGGGTHTFNTSNIAVASLLCAFYPLFPTAVLDNKSHLQAFRHFWVLASEPRCLIVRDVDDFLPLTMPIIVALRSGHEDRYSAPCLLPDLDSIAKIRSDDPQFWPVTVDFARNPAHLAAFKRHQSLYVRRRATYNSNSTVFGSTMQALTKAQMHNQFERRGFEWIWSLRAFESFDHVERTLALLNGTQSASMHNILRSAAIDDRLSLEHSCLRSKRSERLWNLRVLFAWAEKVRRMNGELNWLGKEFVASLKAQVALMSREGSN